MERPNILFIMTDQQSASAMSCAGNPDMHTPAMDWIAESGVRFLRGYCQFPLCLPTRATMFTGLMPHQLGITRNEGSITDVVAEQSLGRLLAAAGYTCAYAGKTHLPLVAGKTIEQTYGWETIGPWNDHCTADACSHFLEQSREKPFFLVASYDNPHTICEWARQQALPYGEVADAPTENCPNLPANFAVPRYEPACIRHVMATLGQIHPTKGWEPDHWRHYRQAYFRLVEKADGEIAKILDTLRRTGLADNTLILFTADHGDGHGAHQINQKSFLYDEITRVPFIIRPPGGMTARVVERELIQASQDILPTLLDYAGIAAPSGLQGRSVRPLITGEAPDDWRSAAFTETVLDDGTQGRMVRTDRFKYAAYAWGRYREQLFDMDTDPGEMVNLAVERRFADELQRHRDLLAQWCRTTDDKLNSRWGIG